MNFSFGAVSTPTGEEKVENSVKLNGEILYYYQNINEFQNFEDTIQSYKKLSEEKKQKLEKEASTMNEEDLKIKIPKYIETFSCQCYQDWNTVTKPCSVCGKIDWDSITINKCREWFLDNERPTFYSLMNQSPALRRELNFQSKVEFYLFNFNKYSNTIRDELTEKILSAVNYENIERFNFIDGPISDPNVIFGFPNEEDVIDDFVQAEKFQTETVEFSNLGETSQNDFQNDSIFESRIFESGIPTNERLHPFGGNFGSKKRKKQLKYDYFVGKAIKLPQVSINNVRLSFPLQDFNLKKLSKSFYSPEEVKFISNFYFRDLYIDLDLSFEYYEIKFSHVEILGTESTFSRQPTDFSRVHMGTLHVFLPSIESKVELDLDFFGNQASFDFSLEEHETLNAKWIAIHDHCKLTRRPITSENHQIVFIFDIFSKGDESQEYKFFSQLEEKALVPHVFKYMEFHEGNDFCFRIDNKNLTQLNHRVYSQLSKFDGWKVSINRIIDNPNCFGGSTVNQMNLYTTNHELLYEIYIQMKKKLNIENFFDLNFKFQ
jgi:hypothetical protein